MKIDYEDILLEWSYRLPKGFPTMVDGEFGIRDEVIILNQILEERGLQVVSLDSFVDNGEPSINEATFDLPTSGLEYFLTKYYDKWVDFIKTKKTFATADGETFSIPIDSKFANAFLAVKNDSKKLERLFKQGNKYLDVIPANKKLISLTKISKDPFTAKTSATGINNLNTEDGKEGLVAYFYYQPIELLIELEKRLSGAQPSGKKWSKLSVNADVCNSKLLKSKAVDVIKSIVDFLNSNQSLNKKAHEKEIAACRNAISCAKAIKAKWGEAKIVDRNDGVFNSIQQAASEIIGLSTSLIDKWCPGDIYLYDRDAVNDVKVVVNSSKQNSSIVTVGKSKGLNSIFDSRSPLVFAISLKEAEALAGGATSLTSFKNQKQLPKGSIDIETSAATNEEKELLRQISLAKRTSKPLKAKSGLYVRYKNLYTNLIIKLEQDVKKAVGKGVQVRLDVKSDRSSVAGQSKEEQLYFYVMKVIALRKVTGFFDNFTEIRDNFASKFKAPSFKNYRNPLEALTAYGVGLAGFNPTFYKVQAEKSQKGVIPVALIDTFKGRDSLSLVGSTVMIQDSPTKAGFKILYTCTMGQKTYKTTLDIRFKGELQLTITVEEFHKE
jgi:hypothetical protein